MIANANPVKATTLPGFYCAKAMAQRYGLAPLHHRQVIITTDDRGNESVVGVIDNGDLHPPVPSLRVHEIEVPRHVQTWRPAIIGRLISLATSEIVAVEWVEPDTGSSGVEVSWTCEPVRTRARISPENRPFKYLPAASRLEVEGAVPGDPHDDSLRILKDDRLRTFAAKALGNFYGTNVQAIEDKRAPLPRRQIIVSIDAMGSTSVEGVIVDGYLAQRNSITRIRGVTSPKYAPLDRMSLLPRSEAPEATLFLFQGKVIAVEWIERGDVYDVEIDLSWQFQRIHTRSSVMLPESPPTA